MEPRFVTANGVKFAYLEQGEGPLVVLAHGFPDTAHTWSHAMGELARAGFRAVAPFMRGIHPSQIPADGFTSVQYGRDLVALIEALAPCHKSDRDRARPGAEPRAALVGHDWGASGAYIAAGLAPERIPLLVTVAIPHPKSIRPGPHGVWALRHGLFLRRAGAPAKIRADNYRYIDELWRRWSPAWQDIPAEETRAAKEAYAHPGCLEAACRYYRSISPVLPPEQKATVKVPAVAFAGEHDNAWGPRYFEKARHCFEASYEVVQVPGGHFMHREHPAEFNRELVRVVGEHRARL